MSRSRSRSIRVVPPGYQVVCHRHPTTVSSVGRYIETGERSSASCAVQNITTYLSSSRPSSASSMRRRALVALIVAWSRARLACCLPGSTSDTPRLEIVFPVHGGFVAQSFRPKFALHVADERMLEVCDESAYDIYDAIFAKDTPTCLTVSTYSSSTVLYDESQHTATLRWHGAMKASTP